MRRVERETRASLFFALFFMLLGWAASAHSQVGFPLPLEILLYQGGTTIEISNTDTRAWEPQINDRGEVTWLNEDGPNGTIFLFDGSDKTALMSDPHCCGNPRINNRGEVVWRGPGGIFLYDGSSTRQLTYSSDDYFPTMNDNGEVAWLKITNPDADGMDVFLYDGEDTIRLTDETRYYSRPRISNGGQVVWMGGGESQFGSIHHVFLFDGTGTAELPNSAGPCVFIGVPEVNDLGNVVWAGWGDETDCEIFLYDGTGTTPLTDNSYDDLCPQINNSGEVVWRGGESWEKGRVFFYDGENTVPLTSRLFAEGCPQINEHGAAVWPRMVSPELLGLQSTEIMHYNGTRVQSITNNVFLYDDYPQINGSGTIVWQGQVIQPWGAASVLGQGSESPSKRANCLFALLVPLGGILFWRCLSRTDRHRGDRGAA